jgi:hypothetical protein
MRELVSRQNKPIDPPMMGRAPPAAIEPANSVASALAGLAASSNASVRMEKVPARLSPEP